MGTDRAPTQKYSPSRRPTGGGGGGFFCVSPGARARGLRPANGLVMLIWQAILALELFLDRELDGPAMARLLEEAMK